jgi:hypothetical protein
VPGPQAGDGTGSRALTDPAADAGGRRGDLGGLDHTARHTTKLYNVRPTCQSAPSPYPGVPRPVGQVARGLTRNPLMPPSTASAVPVVAPASGLAR